LDRVRYLTVRQLPRESIVTHHLMIAKAVQSGDPDAAEHAMRRHLRAVNDDVPSLARSNPEVFTDMPDDG